MDLACRSPRDCPIRPRAPPRWSGKPRQAPTVEYQEAEAVRRTSASNASAPSALLRGCYLEELDRSSLVPGSEVVERERDGECDFALRLPAAPPVRGSNFDEGATTHWL